MAKKMMEIIEHKMDLKNGKVTLNLLDTTFSQLTRKIGSNTGSTWETATEGEVLSKEVLMSLNIKQLSFKPRFTSFITDYNNYIASVASKVALEVFDYNFSSLIDYSSKYVPEQTLADYSLLAELVNAEKELYEAGHFWAEENFKRNRDKLKEWSKDKTYGSVVEKYYSKICSLEGDYGREWRIITQPNFGVSSEIESVSSSAFRINFSNLENLPVGATATTTIKWSIWYYGSHDHDDREIEGYIYFSIKRESLGGEDDDGKFVITELTSSNEVQVRYVGSFYYTNNGLHTPHFDATDLDLPWFKNRILI